MTDSLVIALAQLNPRMGDLQANLRKIRDARAAAAEGGADLVVYSELVLCGYPPEDLVLKPFFQDRIEAFESCFSGPRIESVLTVDMIVLTCLESQ
ncbi:MAG: hypothetical protein IH987_00530 [Planctomycetes bacterium]|nr:hypothetical protein [Planctomycetota bacterium]